MIKTETNIQLPIDRLLYLNGTITCENIGQIIKSINEIRRADIALLEKYKSFGGKYEAEPILLYINSGGGDVYHTMGLLPLMAQPVDAPGSRTPVDTFCLGIAASMALIVFLCGRRRYCTPLSRFLIHNLFSMAIGDITDMKTNTEETRKLQSILDTIIISNSKITKKLLDTKITKKHDWWLSADEARRLGMITSVLM